MTGQLLCEFATQGGARARQSRLRGLGGDAELLGERANIAPAEIFCFEQSTVFGVE